MKDSEELQMRHKYLDCNHFVTITKFNNGRICLNIKNHKILIVKNNKPKRHEN